VLLGVASLARDAAADHDWRHQRQSLPCREVQPLYMRVLKSID
jgi:hypothetical protein